MDQGRIDEKEKKKTVSPSEPWTAEKQEKNNEEEKNPEFPENPKVRRLPFADKAAERPLGYLKGEKQELKSEGIDTRRKQAQNKNDGRDFLLGEGTSPSGNPGF
jgi:hypothetical protein